MPFRGTSLTLPLPFLSSLCYRTESVHTSHPSRGTGFSLWEETACSNGTGFPIPPSPSRHSLPANHHLTPLPTSINAPCVNTHHCTELHLLLHGILRMERLAGPSRLLLLVVSRTHFRMLSIVLVEIVDRSHQYHDHVNLPSTNPCHHFCFQALFNLSCLTNNLWALCRPAAQTRRAARPSSDGRETTRGGTDTKVFPKSLFRRALPFKYKTQIG